MTGLKKCDAITNKELILNKDLYIIELNKRRYFKGKIKNNKREVYMSIQVNNRILPGMAMSDDSRIIVMQNQPRTRWYEDASGTRIHEKVKQVSRSAFHATQNFYPTETPTTGRYYTLSMEMETMQPVKNDAK